MVVVAVSEGPGVAALISYFHPHHTAARARSFRGIGGWHLNPRRHKLTPAGALPHIPGSTDHPLTQGAGHTLTRLRTGFREGKSNGASYPFTGEVYDPHKGLSGDCAASPTSRSLAGAVNVSDITLLAPAQTINRDKKKKRCLR